MKTSIHLFLLSILSTLVFLGCSGPAGTQKYEERSFNPKKENKVTPDPSGKNAMSFEFPTHGPGRSALFPPSGSVTAAPRENFGEEVSRLVYEKDEIVSVL